MNKPTASLLDSLKLSFKAPNWLNIISASNIRKITAIVFFLSGFSSLLYQTVWQRILTQEIGVDSLSISFIVTIFMIGLGFGALFGGKIAVSFSKNLYRIYALIEIVIGIFGFFSIQLIRWVNSINLLAGDVSIFNDFSINFLILAIPTFLMGTTTPMVIHLLRDTIEDFGEIIGIFYGVNIIGAAIGSLASIFLIEILKINGVVYLAAIINVLIGGIFFVYGAQQIQVENKINERLPSQKKLISENTTLSCIEWLKLRSAIFLFGYINLSFQMIIFRILTFYFGPMPFLFPSILFTFLLCMGFGQAVGGTWIDKAHVKGDVLAYLFIGGFCFFLIAVSIPFVVLDQIYGRVEIPILSIPIAIILSLPFLLPTSFFSAYLPVVSRLLIRNIDKAGSTFGGVLFWSTVGNIFGAFVTPIFLFDTMGTIITSIITAWICYFAVFLINTSKFIYLDGDKITPSLLKVSFVVLILFTVFFPKDFFYQSFSSLREISKDIGKSTPIEIFEGRTSITPVYFDQIFPFRLVIRPFSTRAAAAFLNKSHIGVPYFSLAVTQALDPTFRPKRVLELGLGSGEFPYVIKELPSVEKVIIVELNPEVINAFNKYSYPEVKSMFQHPKVELNIIDARRYVQKALTKGEKFDVIQIGVQTDRKGSAGVSNLYSREFFEKLTKLLTLDGMLIIEPYIAVNRLAFEFFEYGYTLNGSSWTLMRNKPFPNAGEIIIDNYIMNLLNANDIIDINNNLNKSNKLLIKANLLEFNKQDVIQHFPNMICTDYNPIFEYYYISSLFKNYVRPTDLIYEIDVLKPRKIDYIFHSK